MTPDCLFTYGTLRPGRSAHHLVEAAVIRHEAAVLEGYRLESEGHRFPWCVDCTGEEVEGDLLWLSQVEGLFAVLDEYEGLRGSRSDYRRVVADVRHLDGITPAWVYVG